MKIQIIWGQIEVPIENGYEPVVSVCLCNNMVISVIKVGKGRTGHLTYYVSDKFPSQHSINPNYMGLYGCINQARKGVEERFLKFINNIWSQD